MKDSTRRALRTAVQAVIALPTLVPALYTIVDWLARWLGADNKVVVWGLSIIGGLTAMAKLVNAAEERGWIPALLKQLDGPPTP